MAQIFNMDKIKAVWINDRYLERDYVYRKETVIGHLWWKQTIKEGFQRKWYYSLYNLQDIIDDETLLIIDKEVYHRACLTMVFGGVKKELYFDTYEEAKKYYVDKVDRFIENKLTFGMG